MKDRFMHGGNVYAYTKEIMDFSANINPLGLSAKGIANCRNWETLVQHYPEPNAVSLRKRLSAFYQIPENEIVLGNGATELLYILANILRPEEAWIPAPTFSEYERAVLSVETQVRYWRDLADLENQRTNIKKNGWICVCTPNNPDGRVLQSDEFEKLLNIAIELNAWLIIDESFIDFTVNIDSYRTEIARYHKLMILHSFTKFWAIPGLRVGALYANADLVERVHQKKDVWNINVMASQYLLGALDDIEYYQMSRTYMMKEKERIYALYSELSGVYCFPPSANFLLLRFNHNYDMGELQKYILGKGYLVRDCSNYVGLDSRYIRIAVRDRENNNKLYEIIKALTKERE